MKFNCQLTTPLRSYYVRRHRATPTVADTIPAEWLNRNVSIDEWEQEKKNPVQLLGPKKDANGKFPRLSGSEASKLFYSGAFFDVIIRIYGYDGKGENPDRINASLEAIKFKKHGDAFGSKPVDADSMFDEEDDDDLDDDLTGGSSSSKASADEDDMLG